VRGENANSSVTTAIDSPSLTKPVIRSEEKLTNQKIEPVRIDAYFLGGLLSKQLVRSTNLMS
jgi:hypothetical protein